MPQFDLATYSGQLFWLAVCFIILNITMIRWLLPRLQQSIALRKNRLLACQQETQTLLTDTAVLNNEIDKRLSTAHHQAFALIQQGLLDIKTMHKESLTHYDHNLAQKLASYEATLAAQFQIAHQELQAKATDYAEQLSEKYMKEPSEDQGITL